MNDKGIVRVGKVTSDKMDKKCVVTVTRTVMHPIYKKRVQKNTKFMVHDEKNEAGYWRYNRVYRLQTNLKELPPPLPSYR